LLCAHAIHAPITPPSHALNMACLSSPRVFAMSPVHAPRIQHDVRMTTVPAHRGAPKQPAALLSSCLLHIYNEFTSQRAISRSLPSCAHMPYMRMYPARTGTGTITCHTLNIVHVHSLRTPNIPNAFHKARPHPHVCAMCPHRARTAMYSLQRATSWAITSRTITVPTCT
jgi:hypothetical protein